MPISLQSSPRDFSLDTLLRANATQHATRKACVDGDQRLTYAELHAGVEQLAHWLIGRGISSGERVPILMTDGAPYLKTLLACGRIGAIAVLLNWRLAAGELAWIIGNCEPSMTFANPRFADLLRESKSGELIEVDENHAQSRGMRSPRSCRRTPSLHDVYQRHDGKA